MVFDREGGVLACLEGSRGTLSAMAIPILMLLGLASLQEMKADACWV